MQPVRQAMGLDGVKALEIEQGIDEARGGGIAVEHRHQVGAERVAEVGLVAQRFVIGLADQIARQRLMIEPFGDAVDHRVFQAVVVQHGRIDEGRQFRLAADNVLRLGADANPDRIERRQFRVLRIDLMHGHDAALANSSVSSRIIARRADGCPVMPFRKIEPARSENLS